MTHDSRNLYSTRLFRLLAAVAAAAALGGVAGEVRGQGSPVYTVAKVEAEARAKDAVTAKAQALEEAQQRALRTVMKRIAPFGAYDRIPQVKASLLQDLLEGFSVRSERNSATEYLATLDIEFRADAVRQLLGGYGILYTDQQAPRITVLPVYVQNGEVATAGTDPWRRAWLALDLEHALAPVKLGRTGSSFTKVQLDALLRGDEAVFEELRDKLKTDRLVLAVAEPAAEAARFETRLYGVDSAGPIALSRSDRVYGKDMKAPARVAALIALGIIEGRWKAAQSGPGDDGATAARSAVRAIVEFAGLGEWQKIRARLVKVPGVQGLTVNSLSARTADISFQYPGGAVRLNQKLAAYDFVLQQAGDTLVLRSR